MVDAGAFWVRPRGVYWSEVQPTESLPPDWTILSGLEQELQNANDQGMQVILKVQSSPEWAQAIPGVACGPVASDQLIALGDFMFNLVDRYKDQVNYWELWNEPDVDPDLVADKNGQFGCWGDENDQYYGGGYYAEMLKVVYPRIKDADPDAQVLLGGLLMDCDPQRVCPNVASAMFLDGILVNGGGDYFDGISFHAYDYYYGALGQYGNSNWQTAWNTTGPVGMVKASYIRSVLNSYNVTGKYLLNTEVAVVCDVGCDNDFQATKANYLAESYAAAFASDLTANLWFSTLAVYRNTDLFDSNLTPYPAYYAYQFGQSELVSADYLGMLNQPGLIGYEFRKNDCPTTGQFCRLWLVRSLDGESRTIELPELPFNIYDVYGNSISPVNQIDVTVYPTYVELPPEFSVRLPQLEYDNQPLENGDFEGGVDSFGSPVGWIASSTGNPGLPYSLVDQNPTIPNFDGDIPRGANSMLLGWPSYPCSSTGVPLGAATIEQSFTVPNVPDGVGVKLEFNYVIYTQDGGASPQLDRFEVYVDQGSGNQLVYSDGRADKSVSCQNWYRLPGSGWQTGSIDLISPIDYRGGTIKISFQNWNRVDGWFNTFTYLDDVELVIGN